MAITSIMFLFLFLPVSLSIYHISNNKVKEYVLLFISLIFYSFGSLDFLVIFIISIIITVFLGRRINEVDNKKCRTALLIIGVVCNSSLLIYYKYTNFMIKTIDNVFGLSIETKRILLPVGISFFTFKAISYLADVYRKKVVLDENPIHDALYLSVFTQIQSGPLSRYDGFVNFGISDSNEKTVLFQEGIYRFIIGFNKKILLANVLNNITSEVFSAPMENFSVSYAWLGSICYSLQLFFDFSGYSDMAIGLSEMFGYRCIENFDYPYTTESVSRFWRRWHISLSLWFRDYIYIPLGGAKNKNKVRVYFNLFVVWFLTGVWHGTSWNFIVWGLGYFVVISIEKLLNIPNRFKSVISKGVYRLFTLLFINIQWILFRANSIKHGLRIIKRLFICESNKLADSRSLFLFKEYMVFILFAILLCFPIIKIIESKLEKNRIVYNMFQIVYAIILIALFVISLSFVVSGQNNPFAYANF